MATITSESWMSNPGELLSIAAKPASAAEVQSDGASQPDDGNASHWRTRLGREERKLA